jgi:hypothetical protein
MADFRCRESVSGIHVPDHAGLCRWCRQRVDRPAPRPQRFDRSELTEAYGYHYDPDWGVPR